MKSAKLNTYIVYIFGKIEFLSMHATKNHFKMYYFNDLQERIEKDRSVFLDTKYMVEM